MRNFEFSSRVIFGIWREEICISQKCTRDHPPNFLAWRTQLRSLYPKLKFMHRKTTTWWDPKTQIQPRRTSPERWGPYLVTPLTSSWPNLHCLHPLASTAPAKTLKLQYPALWPMLCSLEDVGHWGLKRSLHISTRCNATSGVLDSQQVNKWTSMFLYIKWFTNFE